jgi:hypothetical protein
MTQTEIAEDAGVDIYTVSNWLNYWRHMTWEKVLGKKVVRREEYARFKREHPELIKTPVEAQ